jgi:hypothetical protein
MCTGFDCADKISRLWRQLGGCFHASRIDVHVNVVKADGEACHRRPK